MKADYIAFYNYGKSREGGQSLQKFIDLGNKLFGQASAGIGWGSELDLAFKHFKTGESFANYWLKQRPAGLLLTPLQAKNPKTIARKK